jgi:hypothetical protein
MQSPFSSSSTIPILHDDPRGKQKLVALSMRNLYSDCPDTAVTPSVGVKSKASAMRTLSLLGLLLSFVIFLVNLQMYRSLQENESHRVTSLSRIAQLDASEVEELWEHGRDIGRQLQSVSAILKEAQLERQHLLRYEEDAKVEYVRKTIKRNRLGGQSRS